MLLEIAINILWDVAENIHGTRHECNEKTVHNHWEMCAKSHLQSSNIQSV